MNVMIVVTMLVVGTPPEHAVLYGSAEALRRMEAQRDRLHPPGQERDLEKVRWKIAAREWTDSEGSSMYRAALVGEKNGFAYLAKGDDWKTEKVSLNRLSDEDRRWVKQEMDRRKKADKKRKVDDAKRKSKR